ncbi:hypothetical protein KFL_004480050 [Klebsormidium nitens]|uniref:Uncharacterized protein n=1 Tax=Klebsormidium nitens TaxID=105231 RepID=A0A1Y1IKM6_KLENI|nr:hypothetical protein KFL_004480050 [Klebsormidium nitens]|eukprot:GAQ88648.1 hypothetical protein KFL_004480050 [Klebsormidium nitens]
MLVNAAHKTPRSGSLKPSPHGGPDSQNAPKPPPPLHPASPLRPRAPPPQLNMGGYQPLHERRQLKWRRGGSAAGESARWTSGSGVRRRRRQPDAWRKRTSPNLSWPYVAKKRSATTREGPVDTTTGAPLIDEVTACPETF